MIDLDELAERAIESLRGPAPSMERIHALHQRRSRRARTSRVAVVAAIVIATAGAIYAVTRNGPAITTRVVSPAQEQTSEPNDAATTTTLAPGVVTSASRPVLDDCTATYATEATVENSPFTAPRAPAEVFANPARGASGPLASVLRWPGNGTPNPADGNVGGLVANGDVHGREANFEMSGGLQGGASWDLADGGRATVYTRGLTVDELHAFVSQIDGGGSAFPQGLQSVGITDSAHVARSTCIDAQGVVAQITEVTGSLASRYAEMISTSEGSHTFDTGRSSIAIEAFPGKFDSSDTRYHEATPEQWAELLKASQHATIPADTLPAGTTPPTRAP